MPADSILGTPEYYEFSDSLGTYNVIFVDVGFLQGDYILAGITVAGRTIYRFVGEGQGRYIVGKALPLPQAHSIYTGRLTRAGGRFLDVDLQYNISDFDANTLSPLDDRNNVGDAGEARIRLKAIPLLVGTLDLTGTMSTIEDTYRSLEKTRPTYFYRDWNLENELLVGREVLQEGTTTFKRNDSIKLDYSMGKIRRDNFDGTKQEVRASVVAAADRKLTGRAFTTDTDGDRDKRTREHGDVAVSYGLWKFVPAFEYTTEEYLVTSEVTADSGIAFDRYVARVGSRNTGRLSYSIFAEQRDTEEFADTGRVWVETRTDQAIGGSLSSRRYRSLQGEVRYTHRIRDDKVFNSKSTSDLARLNGLVRLEPLGVRSTLDYEISQNRQRAQQRSVVFVGEGQGDYNELGEPVGKGRGAFTIVYLPTTLTVPTSTLDFTWNLTWKMKKKSRGRGPFSWILSNVSLNQSFRVREETTARDAYKVYLLFPSALQRDESTLAGIVSLRQEWSLLDSYPNWSLSVKYQRDDEEENRFNNVNEERLFEQQLVRLDRSLTSRLSANIELRREIKQRGGRGLTVGVGSTFDVLGLAAAAGWGLRFSAGSTLDGEIEYRQQEDSESGAREVAITFRPRFVWRLTKSLNLFGRYEVTQFTLSDETGIKPFYFANPGTTHRWALTPNLRLSKVISLLGTYQGRSEETFSGSRIVDHELTVETRAYF